MLSKTEIESMFPSLCKQIDSEHLVDIIERTAIRREDISYTMDVKKVYALMEELESTGKIKNTKAIKRSTLTAFAHISVVLCIRNPNKHRTFIHRMTDGMYYSF